MNDKIYFIKEDPEFGCFSNFSPDAVEIDGKKYQTSEHYYQAMKTLDENEQENIRNAYTAHISKQLGRAAPLRPDFDEIKDDIMRKVLRAKFTQNEALKRTLLSTGEREIIELSPWDEYWGCGKKNKGLNMLGKLLMDLREKLKNE